MIKNRFTVFLLVLAVLMPSRLFASFDVWKDAVWDLGVGAGGFIYNLYPGSADTDSFVVPLPYFTYTSPVIEIDRGITGFLYQSDSLEVDISADFALPVNSRKSGARQGMPNLDAVLQLGPSLEWLLSDRRANVDARFELPLRIAVSSDLQNVKQQGWLLEPRFSLEHKRQAKQGMSYKATIGVRYATSDYHAYYYDVLPAFVTAQRSGFSANGGYGGVFAKVRASYRSGNWILWVLARHTALNDAAFVDSPLVEQKNYNLFAVGFAWVFAQNR